MKRVVILLVGMLLLGLASCRTEDIKVVDIQVPDMKTEEDARAIGKALAAIPELKEAEIGVYLERRTVTVTYDSMKIAIKNLEHVISGLGYATVTAKPDGSMRPAVPAMKKEPPPKPEVPAVKPPPAGPVRVPAVKTS